MSLAKREKAYALVFIQSTQVPHLLLIQIPFYNLRAEMAETTTSEPPSPMKSQRQLYVFFNPKPTIRVCMKFTKEDIEGITLSDLILKCLRILNEDYMLQINPSKSCYMLFPANKTGSKRAGYPELDSKLPIAKTNMKKFFLEEVNKAFSLISTEFNLEKKYGLEKKPKSSGICCSLFDIMKV